MLKVHHITKLSAIKDCTMNNKDFKTLEQFTKEQCKHDLVVCPRCSGNLICDSMSWVVMQEFGIINMVLEEYLHCKDCGSYMLLSTVFDMQEVTVVGIDHRTKIELLTEEFFDDSK